MSRVCVKVYFTRDNVPKCVVDTSIERCENHGEHIQCVDSVFQPAFAVKMSGGITFDPRTLRLDLCKAIFVTDQIPHT